jgi:hypothetical protein
MAAALRQQEIARLAESLCRRRTHRGVSSVCSS